MGTFHHDKSELHGITVVVDTKGPKVFVGRCDDMDDSNVILLDADEHEDGKGGKSKQQYVERAAKFGVWKKHDRLVIPRGDVSSVQRLGEVRAAFGGNSKTQTANGKQTENSKPQMEKKIIGERQTTPNPPAPFPKREGVATTSGNGNTIVTLTANAQAEVRRLLGEEKPGAGLRLGVKGGGCSGLVYKLEFDAKKEGDVEISYDGFSLFMDKKSTIYLRGITLDHQKGLQGKGFVFHNPNATNTCGCGESFSV